MYLVIGYKPQDDDYCRGCYMGSYSAGTAMHHTDTPEEAARFIAATEANDIDGRRHEWYWTVVTAKMIDDEYEYFGDLECDNISEDVLEFLEDARKERYAKAEEEAAAKEKLKKAEAAAKRASEQAAKDLADYARLRKQFGDK